MTVEGIFRFEAWLQTAICSGRREEVDEI